MGMLAMASERQSASRSSGRAWRWSRPQLMKLFARCQKFDHPTSARAKPPSCCYSYPISQNGSSGCKRRRWKCCIQGVQSNMGASPQHTTNPGCCRTRRSPARCEAPTSLLREVCSSEQCKQDCTNKRKQPSQMRSEQCVPRSNAGRTPTDSLLVSGTEGHGQDGEHESPDFD